MTTSVPPDDGGQDATVAASTPSTPTPHDTTRAPVVVRAGGLEDYRDLRPVDPQDYVVGTEIARGGMGRIISARDRRLGRPVAIKELLVRSADMRARFEREARITAKLQHPAIVSILEAGEWRGGEPFYVMELVAGDSFDVVIAARATLEARLALLPTLIAAVDALAYAHSRNIIHRDLKPRNVLVGEFGETVVIDWGLAKELSDPAGDTDLAVGPYRSTPSGETEAGAVMGTPAYMPVEQANGKPVDARADVYALGAMLYHVLAGAPPYVANTSLEILSCVIDGPPPSIGSRVTGVPPDLITIVDKAMARDAAHRYPSAKELAEELKRFQTGQLVGSHRYSSLQLLRRWIRRHRAPVAVAAIAAMVGTALGITGIRTIVEERTRTEVQRRDAEQSRGDAEDLMSFMLGDLRAKLAPLGKVALLDDVATKAVTYYARRGDSLSDAEAATRARARRGLGDVLSAEGHTAEALVEYRTSLEIDQSLADKDPTNADRQQSLASSHDKVGDGLDAQGNAREALVEYQASFGIRQRLAVAAPMNAERQLDLSLAHSRISKGLAGQGDERGALVESRAALAICENVAAQDPTNLDRQQKLSTAHFDVGDALMTQGDVAAALTELRIALAGAVSLAAKDPANAAWQATLSERHRFVGRALQLQSEMASALIEYRAALAIDSALAAADPANARSQARLSGTHMSIGDVLLTQGDAAGALAQHRASLDIDETLAAQDPTNADAQGRLATSYERVGTTLLLAKDIGGALVQFRAGLKIIDMLATKDPANGQMQWLLWASYNHVGDAQGRQRDLPGALASFEHGLAIMQALAATQPTSTRWQTSLAESHEALGDVFLAQSDNARALAEYRLYLAVAVALGAKDPTNVELQKDVLESHYRVGDALAALGDAAALDEYRAALAIAQALHTKDPKSVEHPLMIKQLTEKLGHHK